MDDFTLKVVIIIVCAAVLFFFARRASGSTEIEAGTLPFPQSTAFSPTTDTEANDSQAVSATGREIPFPVEVGDLTADADSKLPKILNYSFRNIDLVKGPSDPIRFFDELIMELENKDDGYRWRESFFVATPTGLLDAMAEDKVETYWGDSTLIVTRYDLKTIIRAVLERYAEASVPTKSEINYRPGTDFA